MEEHRAARHDAGMDTGRELVVIGGGGHALVVAEAALAAGFTLAGFIDDDPYAPLASGSPKTSRLGSMDALESIVRNRAWILGLGDLELRARVLARLGDGAASVIHPTAHVSPSATLGGGVYVGPCAVVHARARIADHAILNTASVVEHECIVGRNAHVAPGAILGGRVKIGEGTLVGIGAAVLPNLVVGAGCVVGGGGVVISGIDNGVTVTGVPARAEPLQKEPG
jgi:sugar O-acyltransferase (sialic acid O-acetyltransferase NeuD family)